MKAGAVGQLRKGDDAPEWGIWFQARCTIVKGCNNNICCLGGNQNRGLLGNERCLLG